MQEQALQSKGLQLSVEVAVAVLLVAGNWMARVCGVDADLVRATREQAYFQKRCEIAEELHRAKLTGRFLAAGVNFHGALAADAGVCPEWRLDALPAQLPLAPHQHEVTLVEALALAGRVLAQQRVQAAQCGTTSRDQQTATGIPIEPMHQFQRLIRSCRAKRLDHSSGYAAAAVYRDTGGLVHDQQALVLMQDRLLHLFGESCRHAWRIPGTCGWRFEPDGWHAQHVTLRHTHLAAHALAVQAHFTLSQQTEDSCARHAGQKPCEHLVDPYARILGADQFLADRCAACG